MSAMKVTIRGLYDYLDRQNEDLFQYLTLPTSTLLNKDTLLLNILQKSDDMESLYSDPYYIQESIKYWSLKWSRTFQKWVDTLALQYEPLQNYDKHDTVMDRTDTKRDITDADTTRTIKSDDTNEATDLKVATKTDIKESTNTDLTETNTISAYNSSTFQPDTSTSTSGSANNNYTRTDGDDDDNFTHTTGAANANYTNRDTDESFTRNDKVDDDTITDFSHSQHSWGKDGTEKYTDMIKSELDLAKWNIYDHITDIFLQEFCIMVY